MNKILLISVTIAHLPCIAFGMIYGGNGMVDDIAYGYQSLGPKFSGGGGYKTAQDEAYYLPHPYKFGYDIKDGYGGGMNQKEEGDEHGNKKGTYGYVDGYGIYRQVDYVADKNGFRATIKTNEPGTANQDPASVYIQSDAMPVKFESQKKIDEYSPSAMEYYAPKQLYGALQPSMGPIYKSASDSVPVAYLQQSSPTMYDGAGTGTSSTYSDKQLYQSPSTLSSAPTLSSAKTTAVVAAIPAKISTNGKLFQMPASYLKPKTIKVYKGLPADIYGTGGQTGYISSRVNPQLIYNGQQQPHLYNQVQPFSRIQQKKY